MKKSAIVLLLIASCFISACGTKKADPAPSDNSVSEDIEDSSGSSSERESLINSTVENGLLYYDSAPIPEDEIKKNIKVETETHQVFYRLYTF